MSISNFGSSNILTVICDLCFLSIENEPMFQCIICKIDLCVHCFYDGLETHVHKKNHDYRVILCSQKTKCNWTILEELIFMNGLDKYGIGNWEFLSKSIGTKTEEEVEVFFHDLFNIKNNVISNLKVHDKTSNPFRSKISIYMNNRQDFDVEFMNDYEDIIKEMEYTDSDEEIDVQAKDAILNGYENILSMRRYRKDIIIDKQIIDVDSNKEFDKQMSRFLDIEKYKFLLEYLSLSQYRKFVYGIYREKFLLEADKKKKDEIDFNMSLSQAEKHFCKNCQFSLQTFGILKGKFIESRIHKNRAFLDELENCFFDDKMKINMVIEFLDEQNYLRNVL